MAKALVAMSGGVDSSVAAYLAMEAGLSCVGGTMLLWDKDPAFAEDAASVASRLGIPFYCFDGTETFRKEVVEPFIRAYESGLTPNPCILCNQTVKFGWLWQQAQALGCDYIVTGHYARIQTDPVTGRAILRAAPDPQKDQSYFLAGLTQQQLSHTRFPLGELTKEQVRQIAAEQGFVTAHKKDSQDICFIPNGDYKTFMEGYQGKTYPCGRFVDLQGNVVGTHRGAVGYTLGQRKGLGLAMGAPVYVCSKDMENNTVTVGSEENLFSSTLVAKDPNFIPFDSLLEPMQVTAKARSRHLPQKATVYPPEDGILRVVFDTPQRAITPGQAVVFYNGEIVVGSATIVGTE